MQNSYPGGTYSHVEFSACRRATLFSKWHYGVCAVLLFLLCVPPEQPRAARVTERGGGPRAENTTHVPLAALLATLT
jgi:hypothetical protein